MLMQADVGKPFSAHVIVLGNEKGGSGKSTTAMHIAVALLQAGQRVATIDLDSRQYVTIENFLHALDGVGTAKFGRFSGRKRVAKEFESFEQAGNLGGERLMFDLYDRQRIG